MVINDGYILRKLRLQENFRSRFTFELQGLWRSEVGDYGRTKVAVTCSMREDKLKFIASYYNVLLLEAQVS